MWCNEFLNDEANIQQNIVALDDVKFNNSKCIFVTLPYFRLEIVHICLYTDLSDGDARTVSYMLIWTCPGLNAGNFNVSFYIINCEKVWERQIYRYIGLNLQCYIPWHITHFVLTCYVSIPSYLWAAFTHIPHGYPNGSEVSLNNKT